MRFFVYLLLWVIAAPAQAQDICQFVANAAIVAHDGKYLGRISNQYSADSVLNEYGAYGSEYSADSIWNEYGQYGGEYSINSPFNPYTSTPPVLIKNGKAIAYLTANTSLRPAMDPHELKTCDFY
jgi:hypothetical protein